MCHRSPQGLSHVASIMTFSALQTIKLTTQPAMSIVCKSEFFVGSVWLTQQGAGDGETEARWIKPGSSLAHSCFHCVCFEDVTFRVTGHIVHQHEQTKCVTVGSTPWWSGLKASQLICLHGWLFWWQSSIHFNSDLVLDEMISFGIWRDTLLFRLRAASLSLNQLIVFV